MIPTRVTYASETWTLKKKICKQLNKFKNSEKYYNGSSQRRQYRTQKHRALRNVDIPQTQKYRGWNGTVTYGAWAKSDRWQRFFRELRLKGRHRTRLKHSLKYAKMSERQESVLSRIRYNSLWCRGKPRTTVVVHQNRKKTEKKKQWGHALLGLRLKLQVKVLQEKSTGAQPVSWFKT